VKEKIFNNLTIYKIYMCTDQQDMKTMKIICFRVSNSI